MRGLASPSIRDALRRLNAGLLIRRTSTGQRFVSDGSPADPVDAFALQHTSNREHDALMAAFAWRNRARAQAIMAGQIHRGLQVHADAHRGLAPASAIGGMKNCVQNEVSPTRLTGADRPEARPLSWSARPDVH